MLLSLLHCLCRENNIDNMIEMNEWAVEIEIGSQSDACCVLSTAASITSNQCVGNDSLVICFYFLEKKTENKNGQTKHHPVAPLIDI